MPSLPLQSSPSSSSRSTGVFVISLDFELYWGLRDVVAFESYAANLRGVWHAVPRLLSLFEEYDVHATWATVGFLLLRDANELQAHRPSVLPRYVQQTLCPYQYIARDDIVLDRESHFAPELVSQILATRHQELATHTYSHFYCLEAPRSLEAFRSDLEVALNFARKRFGATLTSLVFPRNQYTAAHIEIAAALGITAYRGNPEPWMYAPRPHAKESIVQRGARLLDSYVPLTGNLTHSFESLGQRLPVNVPASRFLRPWSARLEKAERLRLRRILRELRDAAERKRVYHLWWHPHNFGCNLEQNIRALREILQAYAALHGSHGLRSQTMCEVATSQLGHDSSREVICPTNVHAS
jgi:peptidoglycan/xylan/chitin deacetylase (PgdA/CDA1 family)